MRGMPSLELLPLRAARLLWCEVVYSVLGGLGGAWERGMRHKE